MFPFGNFRAYVPARELRRHAPAEVPAREGALAVNTAIKSAAEFGRAVRDRRRALGLTQEELAARCGVGKRFIVDLEGGKQTTQLGKALTAANEVGITLVDMGRQPSALLPTDTSLNEPNEQDPLADLPRF